MIRVGCIGRTKYLYDTIKLISKIPEYEIAFIWTSASEVFYEFQDENFKSLANDLSVPFVNSTNIDGYKDQIDADLVISLNFQNIIPESFLKKFKFGVINAHAGDLPRYRGNACPNWAIINEEEQIALSFHIMDATLDSGPIIHKEYLNLSEDTYIGEVYEWIERVVPEGFIESIKRRVDNIPPEQQKGRALRTFPRKFEDSKLDFSSDFNSNYKLIRASSRPFAGAYAYLNHTETMVKIYRAEAWEVPYDFCAISGQIMERFTDNTFLLAFTDCVMRVTDFEVDGKTQAESFKIVCGSLRNRLT